MRPYLYNSKNLGMKRQIPRVETAPNAARLAPRANAEVPPHPGRICSHPGSEMRPYLHSSDNLETKTQIPWVDTAPQGV